MRIGIDGISAGEAIAADCPGGMREYLTQLIDEFRRQRPEYQLVLFVPRWTDLDIRTDRTIEVVKLPAVPRFRAARAIYQQTALPVAISRAKVDVFFATATVAPIAIAAPVVVSIQFLQFYKLPAAYGILRSSYLRALVALSVRKAERVIVFTAAAAGELLANTRVAASRIRVIPHGISINQSARRAAVGSDLIANDPCALAAGRPFVVYVSATYPYKNHSRLIQAFAMAKRRENLPHVLMLVGAEAGIPMAELRAQADRSSVADSVVITGRVQDVRPFYELAALAIMPSLSETFGFPVLEAMALGCPVVASNVGAVAEVADDAAIMVDPYDISALADGIVRGLTDAGLRARLIRRGRERAATFTWQSSAAKTLLAIEEAAAACGSSRTGTLRE